MFLRENTRAVSVGSVTIGGGAPISVQSITGRSIDCILILNTGVSRIIIWVAFENGISVLVD